MNALRALFFMMIPNVSYAMQLTRILKSPQQYKGVRTSLHQAKTIDEVRELLKQVGADINERDAGNGNTILHTAPAKWVPFLLEHGANPTLKNHETFNVHDMQNPVSFKDGCLGLVYYKRAELFWKLVHNDRYSLTTGKRRRQEAEIGYDYYAGLTPPMQAVKIGDGEKVRAFLLNLPRNQVFAQLTSMQVIALRQDFNLRERLADKHKDHWLAIYKMLRGYELSKR